MRKKRPSKAGQNLIRLLLSPACCHRPSAQCALGHVWFKPTDRSLKERGDDLPLLRWTDFREHISGLDSEIQRVSSQLSLAAKSLASTVNNAASEATAAATDAVGNLSRRLSFSSDDEFEQREQCHFCRDRLIATYHECPVCQASVCFDCAKQRLSTDPKCPNCGDAFRNAAELVKFLSARGTGTTIDPPWRTVCEQLASCTSHGAFAAKAISDQLQIAVITASLPKVHGRLLCTL